VINVPRYKGTDSDGIARTEADHHVKCPGCGRWFDMRDLGQVRDHIHDADFEIEGNESNPLITSTRLQLPTLPRHS
jgi:hypothetical protein